MKKYLYFYAITVVMALTACGKDDPVDSTASCEAISECSDGQFCVDGSCVTDCDRGTEGCACAANGACAVAMVAGAQAAQHFLNLRPLPQGQGSLRPGLSAVTAWSPST